MPGGPDDKCPWPFWLKYKLEVTSDRVGEIVKGSHTYLLAYSQVFGHGHRFGES